MEIAAVGNVAGVIDVIRLDNEAVYFILRVDDGILEGKILRKSVDSYNFAQGNMLRLVLEKWREP